MSKKLATKSYVDSRREVIDVNLQFDGTVYYNDKLKNISLLIVIAKNDDNRASTFIFTDSSYMLSNDRSVILDTQYGALTPIKDDNPTTWKIRKLVIFH